MDAAEQYRQALREYRRASIELSQAFLAGQPTEALQTAKETASAALEAAWKRFAHGSP